MARPKKKDKQVMKIAEALGESLSEEVMALSDLDWYPKLADASDRDKSILCLHACGLGQRFIARSFGMSQEGIRQIILRHDPDGRFKPSPAARKAYFHRMCEMQASEAISMTTFNDLQEMTPMQRAKYIETLKKVVNMETQSKHKEVKQSIDYAIALVESEAVEVEEGEIVEEDGDGQGI